MPRRNPEGIPSSYTLALTDGRRFVVCASALYLACRALRRDPLVRRPVEIQSAYHGKRPRVDLLNPGAKVQR